MSQIIQRAEREQKRWGNVWAEQMEGGVGVNTADAPLWRYGFDRKLGKCMLSCLPP